MKTQLKADLMLVLVTPENQVFVPMNVLRQEGGYAYITPVQTGTLSEGQTVRLFK